MKKTEVQDVQRRLSLAIKATAAEVVPSPQAWEGIRQRLADEGRRKVTILSLAKSRLKGGKEMLRECISRQPVWKTATVGVMALALIVMLSLAIPSLTGKPDVVLAAEIAQNSPEVKLACGGEGDVEIVKVTRMAGGNGEVICVTTMGRMVTADVDLKTGKVIEVEELAMPELTDEAKEEAISIAKADPRVKEILDQGGSIGMVQPIYTAGMIKINGETKVLPTVKMVMIGINQGDQSWMARVDMEAKKVEEVIHFGNMVTKAEIGDSAKRVSLLRKMAA